MQELEGALCVVRDAVTQSRIDAARSEVVATSGMQHCVVCCCNSRDTFLNCGHLICRDCSLQLQECPICRSEITNRSRAFV